MSQSHRDTAALVTGGGQGLGYAIAAELISEGCSRVVISGRDLPKGRAAAAALSKGGAHVEFIQADMGDVDAVVSLVEQADDILRGVNALVNSAANTDRGSILDTTPAMWDAIMDVNARGAFFALQRFAQLCVAAKRPGSAVNILSIVVHGGLPFLAPYAASKAALLNITKNAANTLAPYRIRVNGINVGWMDTPGEDATQKKWHGREEGWLAGAEAKSHFGQLVKPEEVAAQAALFLGPRSGPVTGSIIDFDQQVVGVYPDTND